MVGVGWAVGAVPKVTLLSAGLRCWLVPPAGMAGVEFAGVCAAAGGAEGLFQRPVVAAGEGAGAAGFAAAALTASWVAMARRTSSCVLSSATSRLVRSLNVVVRSGGFG